MLDGRPPTKELIRAFLRHPVRFVHAFVVGARATYYYQKATGQKVKWF